MENQTLHLPAQRECVQSFTLSTEKIIKILALSLSSIHVIGSEEEGMTERCPPKNKKKNKKIRNTRVRYPTLNC